MAFDPLAFQTDSFQIEEGGAPPSDSGGASIMVSIG